jgi:hypothetical protein
LPGEHFGPVPVTTWAAEDGTGPALEELEEDDAGDEVEDEGVLGGDEDVLGEDEDEDEDEQALMRLTARSPAPMETKRLCFK